MSTLRQTVDHASKFELSIPGSPGRQWDLLSIVADRASLRNTRAIEQRVVVARAAARICTDSASMLMA